MTAPNEPGRPGDSARNGSGPGDSGTGRRPQPGSGSGRVTENGEAAPWQRGPRPRQTPQRPTETPDTGSTGHSSGVDARLSRYITGTAAPGARAKSAGPDAEGAAARGEGQRGDAYGSELPDLSGPTRRPAPPRKPPPDPAPTARTPERRVQVSNHRPPRGPVRASMQIRRIDPWSTLKVSLILSVALFFVWMIAVAFLYLVLGSMGVWSKLNSNVGDLLNNTSGATELVSSGSIFGGATLIGLVNIVLLTAMATVGALIYNLTTDLIGGIEVTLADRD
ncbi:DUF3566 domain-containing protein [Mycobacterium sp. pUA109]|uniref:DUF3566 domain-containing protein n=1 Tax=Mycobacterium sp. pUA109 TaxID=3238982 RepID=UPI00351BB67B